MSDRVNRSSKRDYERYALLLANGTTIGYACGQYVELIRNGTSVLAASEQVGLDMTDVRERINSDPVFAWACQLAIDHATLTAHIKLLDRQRIDCEERIVNLQQQLAKAPLFGRVTVPTDQMP